MKIKLCGLRREADVDCANECGPDYAGFVFAQGKRQVTPGKAAALRARLRESIRAVGVFVNEKPLRVREIAAQAGLDVVQLHGDEDAAYIEEMKQAGMTVWKAVRVREARDIARAQETEADVLLLDSFAHGAYGGTGKTADWDVIANARIGKPFLLAGGLNAENIVQAIRVTRPWGVDVSSGIETDGCKDCRKMKEIVDIVRGMEHE